MCELFHLHLFIFQVVPTLANIPMQFLQINSMHIQMWTTDELKQLQKEKGMGGMQAGDVGERVDER